jgi:hypothetical protein
MCGCADGVSCGLAKWHRALKTGQRMESLLRSRAPRWACSRRHVFRLRPLKVYLKEKCAMIAPVSHRSNLYGRRARPACAGVSVWSVARSAVGVLRAAAHLLALPLLDRFKTEAPVTTHTKGG